MRVIVLRHRYHLTLEQINIILKQIMAENFENNNPAVRLELEYNCHGH